MRINKKTTLLSLIFSVLLITLLIADVSMDNRFQVTIGIGDQLARKPVDFAFYNNLFETLYYPQEIGTIGTITSISFYNNFNEDVIDRPVKIWLGTTLVPNLSSGWITSSQLSLVYDSLMSFPAGQNVITFTLQQPYVYNGFNLVLMVNRPWETQTYEVSNKFFCQTIGVNRAINMVRESINIDPDNPPTPVGSEISGQFPKTTFQLIQTPDEPVLSIMPPTFDFNQVVMNTLHTQVFNLYNLGIGTLQINGISMTGSSYFTITDIPELPISLAPNQLCSLSVHFQPILDGTFTALIFLESNISPQTHTISLTGTSIDIEIHNMPYIQNFDSVIPPALPFDWSVLIRPSNGGSFVRSEADTTSPSLPNHIRMWRNSSIGDTIIFISPPIAANISMNTLSLRFHVKSYVFDIPRSISVGIMTIPIDASTFTEVQNIDITNSEWTEHSVSFNNYQGNGRYISFKHPQETGYNYTSLFIDSVVIESLVDNDLAATAIIGNLFPTVSSTSFYDVTVSNLGIATQSNYQVKLYQTGDIEIGSVPGPEIHHSENITVSIPWTPQIETITSLYGKVIFAEDNIPSNNQSANLRVNVQSNGIIAVTIGDGNQSARIPLDMYRKNSLFETIFNATEINHSGTITGIEFYNDFQTNSALDLPTKIWLGETTLNSLNNGWIPATLLNLVYDSLVTYPPGTNAIYINFQEPFSYEYGNLVMLVNRPLDTQHYNSSDYFLCQTVGIDRSRNVAGDNVTYNPEEPPIATIMQLSGQFPKTTFFIQSSNSAPGTGEAAPQASMITSIYPNPFNTMSVIQYTVKEPMPVYITIYNIKGQVIKTILSETKSQGNYILIWDGTDSHGHLVGCGLYMCKLKTGKSESLKKIMKL